MRFELLVALRFLREGRGQTAFILLGIAIGVAVQVFLGTLIDGLQRDLINTTVGSSPHIVVRSNKSIPRPDTHLDDYGERVIFNLDGSFERDDDPLKSWREIIAIMDKKPSISAISPIVLGNGFVQRGTERWPVVIRGVQPNRADAIYKIQNSMISGDFDLQGNQLLVGKELAEDARLIQGDNVLLDLPGNTRQLLTIAGVFDLGSQALNETWVFLDLNRAQRLLGFQDEVSSIEAQVYSVFMADRIAASVERSILDIRVDNWKEQNTELLAGLQAQSSSSLTIQVFVLLAVTLGIASVLAVSVVQKSKQIGILKAMGARSVSASRIFLFQGALLGLSGSILGSVLGLGLTEIFLWGTAQATGQPLFPLEFNPTYAATIILFATSASIISALLPARKSAQLNPIDVIRG